MRDVSAVLTCQCRTCGTYDITLEANQDIPMSVSPFLRAASRQASEDGQRLLIRTDNWKQLIAEHDKTTISDNIQKLLLHVMRRTRRPGNVVELDTAFDYTIIDAENSGELTWHLENATETGHLKRSGSHYQLTAKGWDFLMGPSAGGAIPGRCFVAMSFSEEHSPIYIEGIKPAVVEAGYRPVWMKDVLTNEDINYRMIVEIRKAQFVIADFTGLKAGVYFEAGFALGLGRDVFWTTKADDLGKIHFDTNHYQHIVWTTYNDLKLKLSEKVVALLGYGPDA
jgi:hypothetical protein